VSVSYPLFIAPRVCYCPVSVSRMWVQGVGAFLLLPRVSVITQARELVRLRVK
jgi:hypothetical protein